MQTKGLSRKQVLAELKKAKGKNHNYSDGRIMCSMCTNPLPIASEAYRLFLESNLGDPGLFPGSARLEKEVIDELAGLLKGEGSAGFVVSGGTEANLLALLAARSITRIKEPEVVLPESAHFSFQKICNMLNLKPVYARLDNFFQVDPSAVESCISKNTIAIVGTAGTAELGAVDPIDKLSEIALKHGVYLHVDAAFGGLVIPFLTDTHYKFDFSLEGVKSITIDPHKMGMAPIPAGGILFRSKKTLDLIKTKTPYLTNGFQTTFVGTRTGASVAAAWAVFKLLGLDGFKKIVSGCIETNKFLAKGVEHAGFRLVAEPTLNIVAFRGSNSKLLAEKLWQCGWFVSYVPRLDCIRIVIMPHVKREHVQAFLKTLSTV